MKQIVLNYKQTSASTFLAAPLTADCLSVRCYVLPNNETKDSEFRRSSGRKCSTKTPRLYLDIRLSPTNFDPSTSVSGDDNWVYVQQWYCAPIMHVTFLATTEFPKLDGLTVLNSASNTIYWNIVDVNPVFEDYDNGERRLRYLEINLESTDKYQL